MNYQIVLDETLKKLDGVPSLLLHVCCAPCSSYVLEYLSNYFKITVFYYNPNIDTKEEYEKRRSESERFTKNFKTKYPVKFVGLDHLNNEYEDVIKGMELEKEGGIRCFSCYRLRLEKACLYAKKHHFDYFTTTLTISPLKNSQKINEIGYELEKKYDIRYLYSDFKKREGYKRSIVLSHEYNLYRQDYCGCKYSKRGNKDEGKYSKVSAISNESRI